MSVEVVDDACPVRARLPSGWCVRSIGAHTGCACGFHSQPVWVDEQSGPPGDLAEATASRQRLSALVSGLVRRGPVHLHGCWAGDEAIPAVAVKTVPPAWLAHARDPIPDGCTLIIDSTIPCPDDEGAWMDVPPITGIIG